MVRISVVIPACNEEASIASCLVSLQRQTFKDFEIIVVDNNSKDNTARIAQSFGVKVVKETKQGITPARERGFKEASADIIARTDADTIVPQDWLEKYYTFFSTHPDYVAASGSLTFHDTNIFFEYLWRIANACYFIFSRLFCGHRLLVGPNVALRKSAWQLITIHSDDKLVHEDIDLSCHLAKIGKIGYIPHLKVNYSLRRWQTHFWYTFYEYTRRYIRTIRLHHSFPG